MLVAWLLGSSVIACVVVSALARWARPQSRRRWSESAPENSKDAGWRVELG